MITIKNNINSLLKQSYKEIKEQGISSKTCYVWLDRKVDKDLLVTGVNKLTPNKVGTSVDDYILAKLTRYYAMQNTKHTFDDSSCVIIGKIRVSEKLYIKLRQNKLFAMSKSGTDTNEVDVVSKEYWNKKLQGNSIEI